MQASRPRVRPPLRTPPLRTPQQRTPPQRTPPQRTPPQRIPLRTRLLTAACLAVALAIGVNAPPAASGAPGCPGTPADAVRSSSPLAQRELVPPGALSVTLCRYRGLNDPAPRYVNQLVGVTELSDPQRVQSLIAQFNALPAPASGNRHSTPAGPAGVMQFCPADDGSSLLAIFAYAQSSPDPVSVRPTGCSSASNGYITRDLAFPPGQQLRAELQQLTGCNTSPESMLCNSDPLPSSRAVAVPRVHGLTAGVAYRVLHGAGLRVSLPPIELDYKLGEPLHVVAQSPRAGRAIARGGVVKLTFGCPRCGVGSPAVPPHLPAYRVPSFLGGSPAVAKRWVADKTLYLVAHLGRLTGGRARDLLGNYRVFRQRPTAGSSLKLGKEGRCCAGTGASFTPTPLVVWARQITPR